MSYPQFLRYLVRLRGLSYMAAAVSGTLLGLMLLGMVSGIVAVVAGGAAVVFASLSVWGFCKVGALRDQLESLIRS